MLVQSSMEWKNGKPSVIIHLLPSLPETETWQNGSLTGIKTKGNLSLDLYWEKGKLKNYRVYGGNTPYQIIYDEDIK